MITLERNFKKFSSEEIMDMIGKYKGIIYARVSTNEQSEKGYSLDSQIERCLDLGKTKFKYTDKDFITLIEAGEMGDNPNRPALNYAIELLEKGVGKKLFVLHPDRLSRYLSLQTQVSEKVWNAGCDLEFVEMDLDPNNPESMLMYNIQGSIAQYNKAKILANSKRGRISKARKGEMSGVRRIYGYTFDKKNDTLVVNEEEKKVFLEMVDMLLNKNMSCSQIAKELSLRGVEAPRSEVWYQATVTRMLKNETYTGTFYYGKTEVVQKNGTKKQIPRPRDQWFAIPVPPFISEETRQEIIKKISGLKTNKSGRPSDTYLLKGIAKCGRCGSSLTSGVTSKVKSGVYKYYACMRKFKKGYKVGSGDVNTTCHGRNWRVDIVDEYVWKKLSDGFKNPKDLIEQIFDDVGNSGKIEEAKERIKELEKSKADKENERSRNIKLYTSGIIRNEEELSEYINPIDDQLKYIEDDLIIYQNILSNAKMENDKKEKMVEYIGLFSEAINTDDILPEKKKEIINMFIDKVVLHENNTIEIVTRFSLEETGEDNSEDGHKNSIERQDEGLNIYAKFNESLPAQKWKSGDHEYVWESHIDKLEEVCDMHFNQLKTIGEISKELNIGEWILLDILKFNGVDKLSYKELSKRKRKKDYDKLYDLHFNQRMSLNEIYREYGYSQPYIRRVFEDNGVKHLQFVNQIK